LLSAGEKSMGEGGPCRFTEKDAERGSMGTLNGRAVLEKVLSSR